MTINGLLAKAARLLMKGSPDQDRDDHGRFAGGGGSGGGASRLPTDVQDKHSEPFNEKTPSTSQEHIARAQYHQDQAAVANHQGRYDDQRHHERKFEEHIAAADKLST